MKLSEVLSKLEKDTVVLDKAGTKIPTLDEISKAREEGRVETRKVDNPVQLKRSEALKVRMVTIKRAIVAQLPIIWQPTRKLLTGEDSEILGIISGKAVPDTINHGWFMLIRQPSKNLVLAKVHLQASQIDDYQQIIVTR